jgi:flagellar protein FlbT
MALKIELKPRERIIIGDSVITNDDQRTRLLVEGEAPILREKDILTVEQADTPCKKIYLMVQLMYLARDPTRHHRLYFDLVTEVLAAAPSTRPYFDQINNSLLTGQYYKALKDTRRLIEYEQELLEHANGGADLRRDRPGHRESA